MPSIASKCFAWHGWICATRPIEMIFCFITGVITMINRIEWSSVASDSHQKISETYPWVDATLLNTAGCIVIIHRISQFRRLHSLGSSYILGMAILVAVVSSLIYCFAAISFLNCSIADLKHALIFLFLAMDLTKVSQMSQLVLEAGDYSTVLDNIVDGIASIGPGFFLDSTVIALVVSAGTFSGGPRIEELCSFGVLAAIVYYVTFTTFFLPSLSYVLHLSSRIYPSGPHWKLLPHVAPVEKTSHNPILQHVKRLMSGSLFLVHGIRRFSVNNKVLEVAPPVVIHNQSVYQRYFDSSIHLLFMFGLASLLLKYIAYQSHDLSEESKMAMHKEKPETSSVSTQTECTEDEKKSLESREKRSLEECTRLLESESGTETLSDEEVLMLVKSGNLLHRNLESKLKDCNRAVQIRRVHFTAKGKDEDCMRDIPYANYDYSKVRGTCCENVIGYMTVPLGMTEPVLIDGTEYLIPMATTEGALVASTSRGCKVLNKCLGGRGVTTFVTKDGMTRAPVVQMPSAARAVDLYDWLRVPEGFEFIKKSFESTSNYAKLQDRSVIIIGRQVYIRLVATTGDAMGMNMVTKGAEAVLKSLKDVFSDMDIVSISGNMCVDKKPSAMNWIMGRGKSVICEAVIPGDVIKKILKVDVHKLIDTNFKKNFVGSALAGSIGGNNAHSANIIAAIFIACGQDPAQVVGSSSCMTYMERCGPNEKDLMISVNLPCLEVGTVGGGTNLLAQSSCLKFLGINGSCNESPGENSSKLAQIVGAAVLAGELSLMASLTEQSLVSSHLALNRVKR